MQRSQTTIIVPCFNEEKRLNVRAFRDFDAGPHEVNFLFVNDGSTDATADILRELCQIDGDRFSLLMLNQNRGKSEAVRQGILSGIERGADQVGFWDADLATPLDDIPSFCQVMDERAEIEMVFGSRVNLLGRSVKRNLARHYIGRVFATAASAVLRLPIYDTQCGAKLFRATEETRQVFSEPFISRWIFDVELIARYVRSRRLNGGPPVRDVAYEMPLMSWHDVKGSKVKPHHFLVVAVDLVRIHNRYFTD